MKTTLCFIFTLLTFVTLAYAPHSFAQDDSPEYIVKLYYVVPSDQEPLPNIDATIKKEIKKAQLVFAELMENHGFDRKTFTYETDAEDNAVVHHINGAVSHANFYDKFAAAIEKIYGRYSPIVEEMRTITDEHPNTINLVMFDYDDGPPSLCGEAGRFDRVAFVKLGCLNYQVMAHELAHIFGLWHHNIVDDVLILNSYTDDPMLLSFCSAKWLNISRYFNTDQKHSTGPTTTQMLPPLASPPNAVRLRFEVDDPDGLYMAQLVVAAVGGGDVIACKRLHGEKGSVEFETTKISPLLDYHKVTLMVVDKTGEITDFHSNTFPIDITPVLPPAEDITILDPNLASAVQEALGLSPGDTITQIDMLRLKSLGSWNSEIVDIKGLEHALNLEYLSLGGNKIRDLTPLSVLTHLKKLNLERNQVADVSPLTSLIALEDLRLNRNQVNNIKALSNLTQLRILDMFENQVSDISPLTGIKALRFLDLRKNHVAEITALANMTHLKRLHLWKNQVADVSPLTSLTTLEYLDLSNNQIRDVSSLEGLVNLKELRLMGNPIKNRKPLFTLLRNNPNVKIYLKNIEEPLPVSLASFKAGHTAEGSVIKWTTESEVDNAGFYIYRSKTKDGEFKAVNPTMIQGAGTTGERNEYTWTDTTAKPNTVYYYRIEDVSHAGVREQLATVRLRGLVSASGKLTTRWADLKMQQ